MTPARRTATMWFPFRSAARLTGAATPTARATITGWRLVHRPPLLAALRLGRGVRGDGALQVGELAERRVLDQLHHPGRARAGAGGQLLGLVELSGLRALELAARGLRQRSGREDHDVIHRQAQA